MDYIWASGFVLALSISVYLHLCYNIWTKNISYDWSELGITRYKTLCKWSTHMHTGHHTRFNSLDDLGQCFLLPFANVIMAAQPFLSAWTTEMSGARFFSGSLQWLQLCWVYLYLSWDVGYLLRFILRSAPQRCIKSALIFLWVLLQMGLKIMLFF